MNEQKSLMNLLLLSTAALSGYKKGATKQYQPNPYNRSMRNDSPQNTQTTPSSNNTTMPSNMMNNTSANTSTSNTNTMPQMPYMINTDAPNAQDAAYAQGTNTYSNGAYNNGSNYNNNTNYNNGNNYNNNNNYNNGNNYNNNSNYNNGSMPNNMTNMMQTATNAQMGVSPSATAAAQSDSTYLPALLGAIYAADEAIGLNADSTGPFTLPPLEYDYDALEPYISEETLRIHHGTLHQNYVNNLNAALARYPEFYTYTIPEMLLFPDRLPSDIQAQVIHNAGGVYNHTLVWQLIGPPNNTRPTGEFADAINRQFGSFENLQRILIEAGRSVEGTGYAWLTLNPYGRLIVVTTEEQLTPIPLRTIPMLPIDVWEHAYFLDYAEDRMEHINQLFNLIDWNRVGDRYNAAMNVLDNVSDLNS
ncbi:MAG: superoxide dismutase [Cellulosilyticum sp.]|nr:superoxide dismutase [Cellulosilyticum sp.]